MSWLTSSLTALALPPLLILWLLAAALGFLAVGRRQIAATAVGIAIVTLYLLSIPAVMNMLVWPLESRYAQPGAEQLDCDAIVVAGGGTFGKAAEGRAPRLTAASMERVVTAYQFWQGFRLPILVSGGIGAAGEVPEASAMADVLISLGVPESSLALEWWSQNTYEIAVLTRSTASAYGWNTLCLVTSALHMPRAVRSYRGAGLTVVPVPAPPWSSAAGFGWKTVVPDLDALAIATTALQEYLALAWYRVRYGF